MAEPREKSAILTALKKKYENLSFETALDQMQKQINEEIFFYSKRGHEVTTLTAAEVLNRFPLYIQQCHNCQQVFSALFFVSSGNGDLLQKCLHSVCVNCRIQRCDDCKVKIVSHCEKCKRLRNAVPLIPASSLTLDIKGRGKSMNYTGKKQPLPLAINKQGENEVSKDVSSNNNSESEINSETEQENKETLPLANSVKKGGKDNQKHPKRFENLCIINTEKKESQRDDTSDDQKD